MVSLVASLPPAFADEVGRRHPTLVKTAAAFADLFGSARRSLKIIAPYVDPTFTGLVAAVRAPVHVVTTPAPGRPPRPNPVLERCTTMCELTVRYLAECRDRALLFQMQAMTIIADGERAYLGSASLTDTSVHYNLTLGVMLEEKEVVAGLERLFDYFFDNAAVRASKL